MSVYVRIKETKNSPDGVVRSESNPLGHRAVLLLRLGKLLLGAERLVALDTRKKESQPIEIISKVCAAWCGSHGSSSIGLSMMRECNRLAIACAGGFKVGSYRHLDCVDGRV